MSTTTFFEQTIAVLASSSGTNGALGAMEVRGPRGSVPPLHVHHRAEEDFYVVEGDYSVVVGDEVIGAAPGTWVWGTGAVPHGHQVLPWRGRNGPAKRQGGKG